MTRFSFFLWGALSDERTGMILYMLLALLLDTDF
jgi:hypothetical protein